MNGEKNLVRVNPAFIKLNSLFFSATNNNNNNNYCFTTTPALDTPSDISCVRPPIRPDLITIDRALNTFVCQKLNNRGVKRHAHSSHKAALTCQYFTPVKFNGARRFMCASFSFDDHFPINTV